MQAHRKVSTRWRGVRHHGLLWGTHAVSRNCKGGSCTALSRGDMLELESGGVVAGVVQTCGAVVNVGACGVD